MLTAGDVRACIQNYFGLGGDKYSVLFEVRNATAFEASRSIDAVAMSLWPSLGLELMGMEIKVSRSDWLRELKSPAKASDVIEYFDRWYLVAPEEIVKSNELPPPWGWLVPKKGTLVKYKEAPKAKKPRPVDRKFLAALLRRVAKSDDSFVAKAINDAITEYRKGESERVDRMVQIRMRSYREDAEEMGRLREALGEDFRYVFSDEVIAAVKIVRAAGLVDKYGTLYRSRDLALEYAKRIDETLREFGVERKTRK